MCLGPGIDMIETVAMAEGVSEDLLFQDTGHFVLSLECISTPEQTPVACVHVP